MTKLNKKYYYDKDNNKKLNCFFVNLSKEIVKKTDIQENDDINVRVNNKKIIIERKNENEMCIEK